MMPLSSAGIRERVLGWTIEAVDQRERLDRRYEAAGVAEASFESAPSPFAFSADTL